MSAPAKPFPVPDELSAPFWAACNRGELVVQRCSGCRHWQHQPSVLCLSCGSASLSFERASGRGRVHSYTIVHDARYAAFRAIQPYPLVAVELDEQPELILLSNMPGTPIEAIRTGLEVEVWFERVSAGQAIPQFRPREGAAR